MSATIVEPIAEVVVSAAASDVPFEVRLLVSEERLTVGMKLYACANADRGADAGGPSSAGVTTVHAGEPASSAEFEKALDEFALQSRYYDAGPDYGYMRRMARARVMTLWKVALAASAGEPAQFPPLIVPPEVMRAAERMATPLHESRLSGVTATEDARCSQLVLSFLRELDSAATPAGEPADETPLQVIESVLRGDIERAPSYEELRERHREKRF